MKVLVSDFDNTFYTVNYEENIKKVNEFVDKGNIFIIATGRYYESVINDISYYNIKYSYLICNDGALIFDNKQKIVYQKNIIDKDAKEIFDIFKKSKHISESYVTLNNGLIYNCEKGVNTIIGRPRNKKGIELFKNILNSYPSITGYISSTTWLNIRNNDTSKGNAIKELIKLKLIPKKNIYTIGDGLNDISMMKDYNSYSVHDSHESLKDKSKNQVSSFTELVDKL